MRRPARALVLCLLLVLLPLRSLLAAGQLACEPAPTQPLQMAHAHHAGAGGAEQDHAAKPCKLCAPCCLAAAPPPVLALDAAALAPAGRAALTPAEDWAGIVPPLPDPPPRA